MTHTETLSLCMIVRNEAANLGTCLDSVRTLVDDIVIVDTGSTDDTVAIAESYGAVVLHEPWADDYSAPRNTSLAAAAGTWTLVLDADEVLAAQDHDAIRAAMARTDVMGFRMRTRNYVRDADKADAVRNLNPAPEGAGYPAWIPSDKVRLFRTDPRVRFRGVIHELLDESIQECGGAIEFLDVPVHHYGFLVSEETRAQKRIMQRRIADRKIAETPEDFKAHYEWAVIAHTQGDFAAARPALDRSIALKADWAPSQYELGYVCEQLEEWGAAVEAYRRALACDPTHLSASLNLGILAVRAGLLDEAERVLRAATAHHGDDPRAWNNLGVALAHLKRHEDAADAWRHALRLDPENAQALENLDRLPEERAGAPRVSLCMIVRNEAENLRAAIVPVRDLVDEIVVVDTGSTDGTVTLAEKLGAHVVHFPWCDDFAAARNAGLAEATGDWIVWLDADDRVPTTSIPALRTSLQTPADHAVQWCVQSQSGGREPVHFLQLRQFPRRADLQWRGRIHEEITTAVRAADLSIINAPDVVVEHVGYRDADVVHRKHERNVRLLELEHAERPDCATICHHLSQTYNLLGRQDDACALAEHIIALEPLDGDERYLGLQARVRLAQLAKQAGDTARARDLLTQALRIVPHYPPAEYALGELLWKQGEVETAAAHLHNVARAHMPLSEMPLPLPALRAGGWNILGRIAQDRGQHDQAVRHFTEALTHAPAVAVIHANQAESLLALGRVGDAQAAAQRALQLAPADFTIAQRCRTLLAAPADTHGDQPFLSLCMIVRNEAGNLRALLPDVAAVMDDIVIVDTGSTDDSVAVAEAAGARVFHEPWSDDFAAARNVSLSHARGAWVLWLDADDRVEAQAFAALKETLRDLPPQAVRLPVTSVLGGNAITAMSLRLFPTGHNVQWRGRVHEDLVQACQDADLPIIDCFDVGVRHDGYADPDMLREKMLRSRRLLERHLSEQPDDARAELHLAEAERFFGETAAAAARLRAVLQRELPPALRIHALSQRAALACDAGDMEAWYTAAREWFERAPADAAAQVNCAEALTRLDRCEEARAVLEAVDPDTMQPGTLPVNLEALKARHHYLLGSCYRRDGRLDDAVRELGVALHVQPMYPDAIFELANVHWDAGRLGEADAMYRELLEQHPAHAPALVQRGNIAFQRAAYDDAEALYGRALQTDPGCRPARENACVVALARGDLHVARERLASALRDFPEARQLRVYLADLDFGEGQYGPALDGYRQYLTEQPTDVKAITRLGDCLRILGYATQARQAYGAALQMQPEFTLAHQGLAALEPVS